MGLVVKEEKGDLKLNVVYVIYLFVYRFWIGLGFFSEVLSLVVGYVWGER